MNFAELEKGKILDTARELKVVGEYDVIVAGGGVAGFGTERDIPSVH